MKIRVLLFVFLAALIVGFQTFSTNTPTPEMTAEPAAQRVIVISLDGARPDALQMAPAANILALAERGQADWDAQTVYPSVTLPAHASMLTGLSIEEHGLDHNDSVYPCVPIDAPTFLTLAAEAGYSAAMVVGKERMCQFHQTDTVAYTFARAGDGSVIDAALDYLDDGVEVLFVHLPNPDYFGHSTGWMSQTYLNELRNTDFQVGRLLDRVDELSMTDETLIILTADHGGHDLGHGTRLPEDMTIPFIVVGAGFSGGTELQNMTVADAGYLAMQVLGLPLP